MAKKGFKVLDSDMHIMEPPDLWERYIDPEFKGQGPRGLTRSSLRESGLVHPDGKRWGSESRGDVTRGHNFNNFQTLYRSHAERGWTAEVQLEAMDQEGIDKAVLYPTRGLHALAEPHMEPRLAAAIARAYNNWLYDFCQTNPNRLFGGAMISPFSMEDAVSEVRRCVTDLGFQGVFIRANVMNDHNWHDDYYEPLWSALEELRIPLGLHEATGSGAPHVGGQFVSNFMLRRTYAQPMEQMLALGSICAGGVLARHPRLRVGFLEANCTWLPWLLWRLDEGWEREGDVWAPDLQMVPSEYFKQQCYISVEPDEETVKYVIDYMGSERIVFSTDYPHGDSKFPNAVERFLQLSIAEEDKRKILWDNCASYYEMAEPIVQSDSIRS